jgi:hypothetical protein
MPLSTTHKPARARVQLSTPGSLQPIPRALRTRILRQALAARCCNMTQVFGWHARHRSASLCYACGHESHNQHVLIAAPIGIMARTLPLCEGLSAGYPPTVILRPYTSNCSMFAPGSGTFVFACWVRKAARSIPKVCHGQRTSFSEVVCRGRQVLMDSKPGHTYRGSTA